MDGVVRGRGAFIRHASSGGGIDPNYCAIRNMPRRPRGERATYTFRICTRRGGGVLTHIRACVSVCTKDRTRSALGVACSATEGGRAQASPPVVTTTPPPILYSVARGTLANGFPGGATPPTRWLCGGYIVISAFGSRV